MVILNQGLRYYKKLNFYKSNHYPLWWSLPKVKTNMNLPVVPIHKHPKYIMQCCQLINEEWKRSTTARMRSLECSCDTLPTCLILLKGNTVIGHCKLSPIPSVSDGCFIESVVIQKDLRGQGYGKYLMVKAEEYCKSTLKLKVIYLSTKDQQVFYNKLGYSFCAPISIYGSVTSTENLKYSSYVTARHLSNSKSTSPIPPPAPTNNFSVNDKVYMKKEL